MNPKWKKARKGLRATQRRARAYTAAQAVQATAAKPSVSVKTFTNAVLSIVNKKEETKYVAFQPQPPATGVIATITTPANLVQYLPPVVQGIQSNQRIGTKISNVKGRVDFQFFVIGAPGVQFPTEDMIIRIYKLSAKAVKSYSQMAGLTAATLLDNGNQTTTDWSAAGQAIYYSQLPLSHEDFTGSFHEIRLRKNQGQPTNDLGPGQAPNTYGYPSKKYSFTWKHKGNLLYDDTGVNTPTNYAPLYAVVGYNPDNTPFSGLCQYTTRSHMWYKDV